MLREIMIAGTVSLLLAGTALAQDKAAAAPAPANAEQCTKMMDDVLDAFADKQLSDDAAKKADELAQAMDDQCAAGKFDEAVKTAELLRDMAK